MGSVRREVYNQRLMDRFNYKNPDHIKRLFKNYYNLVELCSRGDQVACAYMMDIKTCLGVYGQTILTDRQVKIVKLVLIDGLSQAEVADILGYKQNWISVLLNRAIKNIVLMLNNGGELSIEQKKKEAREEYKQLGFN